jgi:transcription initiation factor IIF auxiliary subunit
MEEMDAQDKSVTFSFFLTSLAMQASCALGTTHPITGKSEVNLTQAKILIDTIEMIREKTQGNLNSDEDTLIDRCLLELHEAYRNQTKGIEQE